MRWLVRNNIIFPCFLNFILMRIEASILENCIISITITLIIKYGCLCCLINKLMQKMPLQYFSWPLKLFLQEKHPSGLLVYFSIHSCRKFALQVMIMNVRQPLQLLVSAILQVLNQMLVQRNANKLAEYYTFNYCSDYEYSTVKGVFRTKCFNFMLSCSHLKSNAQRWHSLSIIVVFSQQISFAFR